MLYLAIISLFVLAVTTLYFAIKYSRTHLATFILIPILVASSLLSYTAITALEGSPIKGFPTVEFTVLTAHVMKPDIVVVVRHTDTKEIKTYMIPFSQANANQMNREKQLAANGVSRKGRFEKNKFGEMRYIVDTGNRDPLPPKNTPPNQQTPSATEHRGGR